MFCNATDAVDAYEQGYNCGLNGANIINCHYGLFSCPEKRKHGKTVKGMGKKKSKK